MRIPKEVRTTQRMFYDTGVLMERICLTIEAWVGGKSDQDFVKACAFAAQQWIDNRKGD
jgi:hypothetical protein